MMHGKDGVKTEHYRAGESLVAGFHHAAAAAALYNDKLSDQEEHLYSGLGQ